ncbi:MAG: hypothetical protein ISR75_01375 [Phycisphaerales bacterium]|nr:hypothetical protein [Planctomycetota bacterium]MBL6997076.1 hypothetical protein [Phycisphaerales bacterium]
MNSQLKKSLFAFGFIGFTAGILWSVNIDYEDQVTDANDIESSSTHFAMDEEQEETKDKPFWSQLMPKTSIEKRDELRSSRQREIASMIDSLHGVSNTTVVLSDNEVTGIGTPRRPMTACVSVEPTNGMLPFATIKAIQKLVSGATAGLSTEQVTVIDAFTGAECSDVTLTRMPQVKTDLLQKRIEAALGLSTAKVTVLLKRPDSSEVLIPWNDDAKPFIQIALPTSWIVNKGKQVGGEKIALDTLRTTVASISPESKVEFQIVDDQLASTGQVPEENSSAKQVALVIGLLALLVAGFIADRRRRPRETVVFKQIEHPYEEARQILAMDFEVAKKTIDALKGPRKFKVLQAIVEAETDATEIPVVQVQKQKNQKQKQMELIKTS